MKNPINNQKAKDGTILTECTVGGDSSQVINGLSGREFPKNPDNELTVSEFLYRKLPRKQPSPDLLSSIRDKIKDA